MIRALVVDDEPLSRRAVRQLCARYADVAVIAECGTAAEAAAVLRRSAVDVVFLDVKMPGLTGLDLARRRQGDRPMIVFVTAYAEYALPAFDAGAVDYLTKPLERERFERTLDRVRTYLGLTPAAAPAPASCAFSPTLVLRQRDRELVVPTESIEYVEAEDVYAAVHAQTGVHFIRQSLDELGSRLDPSAFVRVHRSFIVQIDYVTAVCRARHGRRTLVMRSGAEVPVSRHRRHALERVLRRRGRTGSGGT